MSYVLDALKKADAERERGAVPGLHAQPLPGLMDDARPVRARTGWVALLAAAVVVLLLALFWVTISRPRSNDAPVQPAAPLPAPAVAQAPVPAPAAPPPQPANAIPRGTVAQAARPEAAKRHTPPPEPAAVSAAPAARAEPPAPSPRATNSTSVSSAAKPAASPPPPASAPSAEPAEGRVLALNELPDDVRRQLPPLTVGGSIYSDSPSGRFVIINGQVFHENDQIAPDLILEQIRLKLAVLRYKGTRFRIMY